MPVYERPILCSVDPIKVRLCDSDPYRVALYWDQSFNGFSVLDREYTPPPTGTGGFRTRPWYCRRIVFFKDIVHVGLEYTPKSPEGILAPRLNSLDGGGQAPDERPYKNQTWDYHNYSETVTNSFSESKTLYWNLGGNLSFSFPSQFWEDLWNHIDESAPDFRVIPRPDEPHDMVVFVVVGKYERKKPHTGELIGQWVDVTGGMIAPARCGEDITR